MLQLLLARYLRSKRAIRQADLCQSQQSCRTPPPYLQRDTGPPALLFEIFTVILLNADLADCAALSLVCRAFRYPAQKRLFTSIDIVYPAASDLQSLHSSLLSFRHHCSWIRELTVSSGPCDTLAGLIELCPSLKSLICVQVCVDSQPDVSYEPVIRVIRKSSISYLEIHAPSQDGQLPYGMFNLAFADTVQTLVLRSSQWSALEAHRFRTCVTGTALFLIGCEIRSTQPFWGSLCNRNKPPRHLAFVRPSFTDGDNTLDRLLEWSVPTMRSFTFLSLQAAPYVISIDPQRVRCDELLLNNPWHTFNNLACFLPVERLILTNTDRTSGEEGILSWCHLVLTWISLLEQSADNAGYFMPTEIVLTYHSHQGLDEKLLQHPSYIDTFVKLAHRRCRLWIDTFDQEVEPQPKKRRIAPELD